MKKQQTLGTGVLWRFLWALALGLAACLLAAPAARADEGDYDRISRYVITVDPRQDGSADITYDVDWQVVGGTEEDYLYWVRIGLANHQVDEFQNLSPDTVIDVSYSGDGGSYARVTFKQHYYAPDVAAKNGGKSEVHFSFKVHQSHLFTKNDDDTASYAFTPGWFDDLCVDSLQIRWKNYEGFVADNNAVDGEYLVWDFGPLSHGERVTAHVTVPITAADAFDPAAAQTEEDWDVFTDPAPVGGTNDEGEGLAFLALFFLLVFVLTLFYSLRAARWRGGPEADDGYIYYSNGTHVVHLLPGHTPPPGYRAVSAPKGSGVRHGGGSTRGGGAGLGGGGGCACACASSCACACACAGGGRAGCSVKNIYTVKLPAARDSAAQKEQDHGA